MNTKTTKTLSKSVHSIFDDKNIHQFLSYFMEIKYFAIEGKKKKII